MATLFDNTEYSLECINLTENILLSISHHLSGRSMCRGIVYRVAIGVFDNEQQICHMKWEDRDCTDCMFFDSVVQLRSNSGRMIPVIQHIIIEHFYNVWAGAANGNQVQIYPYKLVPGIYEYRKSSTGKYRRWFKV